MAIVLLALGLVMIVEGLVWVLAPSLIEQMLEMLRQLSDGARRQIGLLVVVTGLILLWIAYQIGV